MTDQECAGVLRDLLVDKWPVSMNQETAIERAIELLSACEHCGGGGAHPGACRWCGRSR